jgi:hypothetical protein
MSSVHALTSVNLCGECTGDRLRGRERVFERRMVEEKIMHECKSRGIRDSVLPVSPHHFSLSSLSLSSLSLFSLSLSFFFLSLCLSLSLSLSFSVSSLSLCLSLLLFLPPHTSTAHSYVCPCGRTDSARASVVCAKCERSYHRDCAIQDSAVQDDPDRQGWTCAKCQLTQGELKRARHSAGVTGLRKPESGAAPVPDPEINLPPRQTATTSHARQSLKRRGDGEGSRPSPGGAPKKLRLAQLCAKNTRDGSSPVHLLPTVPCGPVPPTLSGTNGEARLIPDTTRLKRKDPKKPRRTGLDWGGQPMTVEKYAKLAEHAVIDDQKETKYHNFFWDRLSGEPRECPTEFK